MINAVGGQPGKLCLPSYDVVNLDKEPRVDTRVAVNLFQLESSTECIRQVPDAIGSGVRQAVGKFGAGVFLHHLHARLETGRTNLESAQSFLQRLLKSAPDGHHFAHRFHLGGQSRICGGKFFKGKAWDLGDHIIEGRLERRGGHATCNIVLELIERVAYRQLCCHLGNREASCLGCQRR